MAKQHGMRAEADLGANGASELAFDPIFQVPENVVEEVAVVADGVGGVLGVTGLGPRVQLPGHLGPQFIDLLFFL